MKELPPELPSNPTESVRRRNPHLYSSGISDDQMVRAMQGAGLLPTDKEWIAHATKPPKRIRQSTKPLMNKLEQEWLDFYGQWFQSSYPQSIRFKLGNGIWYKPDFVVWNAAGETVAYEIKGPHSFRGGFENLKVAASKYPQIKWVLCWKVDGKWQEQVVLP